MGNFSVNFGLYYDSLSSVLILIITGIGFLIHLYSVGYMRGDAGFQRYFIFLNLFICFMLLLILADNLLLLFVGWEGVGLCSYLLIGYYLNKEKAAFSANKAFLFNRIGDMGYIVAIVMIFSVFQTLDIASINNTAKEIYNAGKMSDTFLLVVTLLLFFGATGKSAQLPLQGWLPDAMEGPTPVSALIHAATMVTAGVYIVARLSHFYVLSPTAMSIIATIGILTAFFAACLALVQKDIKKILAYSTISQLGYMFIALGVGAFTASIFHLITHAFFKALLF